MSEIKKCPACGQTINSIADAIYCTRRDPCLVASHYYSMGDHPGRFATEEDKVVALMNQVHGFIAKVEQKVEDALGIKHELFSDSPPPPAVEVDSAPEVPTPAAPSVEAAGAFSSPEPATPAPISTTEDSAPVAPESSWASAAAANVLTIVHGIIRNEPPINVGEPVPSDELGKEPGSQA